MDAYITSKSSKGGDKNVFYRAIACNATHGIAVPILSVHPSVRRMYCDITK